MWASYYTHWYTMNNIVPFVRPAAQLLLELEKAQAKLDAARSKLHKAKEHMKLAEASLELLAPSSPKAKPWKNWWRIFFKAF